LIIIDGRHKSFASDIEMKNWFDSYNVPVVIVATKTDKVTKAHLHSMWIENIKDFNCADGKTPFFFSAVTGQGRNELIKEIEARLR
jgi:GTP-binding protein